jgi:hypothetical protein
MRPLAHAFTGKPDCAITQERSSKGLFAFYVPTAWDEAMDLIRVAVEKTDHQRGAIPLRLVALAEADKRGAQSMTGMSEAERRWCLPLTLCGVGGPLGGIS